MKRFRNRVKATKRAAAFFILTLLLTNAFSIAIAQQSHYENITTNTTISTEEPKYKFRVSPTEAEERARIDEPQHVKSIELKVDEEKPVYEIRGNQSVETEEGRIDIEIVSKIDAESGEVYEKKWVIKKNNLTVVEKEDEMLIIEENKIVTLSNVLEKELKREKLMTNSVEPLVKPEKIVNPELREKEKIILQIRKDCGMADREVVAKAEHYDFVIVETDDISEFLEDECVVKIGDEEKKTDFIDYSKEVMKVETQEKIRRLQLNRSMNDVVEISKLEIYMKEEEWQVQKGQLSPYQQFVTPDEFSMEVSGLGKEQIYEMAKSYLWVSDPVLHNKPEEWMLPVDFLHITPTMDANPVKGIPVGDCSEQANTLVSMLRASGVPAEDVRVALGRVNFGGTIGGHAWVEIKEDGKWMVLDPSSGPYYDEETGMVTERDGFDYEYWKYHEYPIVEAWAYYNDKYFTDKDEEVAAGWSKGAETVLEDSILFGFGESFSSVADIFVNFFVWVKSLIGL